mmetsp:Transcript_32897/g.49001  ORF Transcript_32897/g.49001 Transcript_32897/m.49001 type:complete len:109 (+) Transcript_32897:1375-1701(+)
MMRKKTQKGEKIDHLMLWVSSRFVINTALFLLYFPSRSLVFTSYNTKYIMIRFALPLVMKKLYQFTCCASMKWINVNKWTAVDRAVSSFYYRPKSDFLEKYAYSRKMP